MSIEKVTADLTPYYDKEKIIRATFLQIKKDLAHLYNLEEEWKTDKPTFTELKGFFQPLIHELLDFQPEALTQALYRIDLSENDIGHCLTGTDRNLMSEQLTASIVTRELKKVIIRFYYSDKL